jgi:cation:H+ antiporter
VLLAGAELFAENAGAAGRRLGVTGLAVGILLAGAEPEELITAVTASLRGRPGIGAGDAIGANVTMLTLTVGLAASIRPLPLRGRVRTYAVGATVAGAAAALVLADGQTGRAEGAALVALYVGLVAVVWVREREAPVIGELVEVVESGDGDDDGAVAAHCAGGDSAPDIDDGGDLGGVGGGDEGDGGVGVRSAVGLALALVGVAVMAAGGSVAVAGAERIVEAMSASDTAVGLTLVALATTAELFALVWSAARRDVSELAVAAIVGSAAYNATATLGAAVLVRPASGLDLRAAAVLAAALPVLVVAAGGGRQALGRVAGLVLVAVYVVYVTLALA